MSLRHEMLSALCLLDHEKGRTLFQFSSDEALLNEEAQVSGTQNSKLSRRQVKEKLLKIAQSAKTSPFNEIHPEWILEKLEGESPRVLKFVNDKWSGKEIKMSPEIADLVWKLVERKIDLPEKVPAHGSFGFENISWLQEDELKILFHELGVCEIVKAFQGVPNKILKPFFARFSLKEATDLRHRIERSGFKLSETERSKAQKNILNLTLEEKTHDEIMYDIGVTVFMKATALEDEKWMEWIFQKFPPSIGYQLKRTYFEHRSEDLLDLKRSREAILAVMVDLAEHNKIRRYWKAR